MESLKQKIGYDQPWWQPNRIDSTIALVGNSLQFFLNLPARPAAFITAQSPSFCPVLALNSVPVLLVVLSLGRLSCSRVFPQLV